MNRQRASFATPEGVATTIWDAIVVGAGPSGIFTWHELRRRGLNVLLIEAGGREAPVGDTVDEERWRFRAAGRRPSRWLRTHAIGGRTSLWGGWASTFPAAVLEAGGWPVTRASMAAGYRHASAWLRVSRSPAHPRYLRAARRLGWRAAGCASVARDDSPWLRARAEAVASALTSTVALSLVIGGGRATALRVLRGDGPAVELRARRFVLAASPIESARLLIDSGARHPAIGRGLTDHTLLSYVLIDREPSRGDRAATQMYGALVDPFAGGGADARARAGGGRFTLELMGPVPLARLPAPWLAGLGVASGEPGLATYIHAMGEQRPHAGRRVALAARSRDSLGRLIPVLHLGVSTEDRALRAEMERACLTLADTLANGSAMLQPFRDTSTAPMVYHPASTCVMGHGDDAPCDPHGRLREWPNVWLADASVMPTSGDRHPTLTVLAHALRAARDAAGDRR